MKSANTSNFFKDQHTVCWNGVGGGGGTKKGPITPRGRDLRYLTQDVFYYRNQSIQQQRMVLCMSIFLKILLKCLGCMSSHTYPGVYEAIFKYEKG